MGLILSKYKGLCLHMDLCWRTKSRCIIPTILARIGIKHKKYQTVTTPLHSTLESYHCGEDPEVDLLA